MAKSAQNIVNERVAKVSEMLIEGKGRAKILQFNSGEGGWSLSDRQIDSYIAKAREFIVSEIKRDTSFEFAKAMKRLESLYCKALESSNYRLALAIIKELSLLQGITKIQFEHSGDVTFLCSIPD